MIFNRSSSNCFNNDIILVAAAGGEETACSDAGEMRAALPTLLLLISAATGTNQSLEDGEDVCVEAVLRRVTITPDKLPVALLATSRPLADKPWLQPAWDWETWARELLETHQDIQVRGSAEITFFFKYISSVLVYWTRPWY